MFQDFHQAFQHWKQQLVMQVFPVAHSSNWQIIGPWIYKNRLHVLTKQDESAAARDFLYECWVVSSRVESLKLT